MLKTVGEPHHSTAFSSWCLFVLGLFSATKVYFVGCVAISELIVFFVAPIVYWRVRRQMRYEGFLQFIRMLLAVMAAMFVSSLVNGTAWPFVVKDFANIYSVLAYYVVFYSLLRNDMKRGLGWFFLGAAFSGVITIFALNPQAQVLDTGFAYVGNVDSEDIIKGPLFWIQKIKDFGQLPIFAAYLKTPLAYSLLTPILFSIFALMTTVSGRSATLSILLGGALMCIGRKSRRTMLIAGQHFFLFLFLGCSIIFLYKGIYAYTAKAGILGEDAIRKYEYQTKGKGGMLQLLMSGRKEFFISIPAILEKPLLGHGPHALDSRGYAQRFFQKYADPDEFATYLYYLRKQLSAGFLPEIPSHSHIMGAWLHYGIIGLLFYVWFLYVIFKHIRHYAAAIPQWYGYFSVTIASYAWHIFFSPFGARPLFAMFAVCLFFARAVGMKKITLPYEMEKEACEYDCR